MSTENLLRALYSSGGLTPEAALLFRQIVYGHYRRHGRTLPWRETHDPYAILVSEIMLQQTQVDRVTGKYMSFLSAFPDFRSLAAATLDAVLSTWQGLGYNRRALNLKRCAEAVVTEHGGTLPSTIAELEKLPGIGHYTARAVAAFAFSVPSVFIETNIRTVFIHHFFNDSEKVHDREITPLVEGTLDHGNPREWYYALMDYGAHLKRLHGNPSRRSAHHATQSPFKGSNRELRSLILKAILDRPGITLEEIMPFLNKPQDAALSNLKQMEAEGFIAMRKGRFFIA
ncbi:A/G-specific adenine glycosylase [Geobacter hydrogenophilus]|uniref:Adenine DNA glycosylase n=1 Tax=Geobacter hydrogenophilus TaxID=40983 RepID=A0A9W6G1X0_9BACT|nr:A/G-specific adenine glycosylase [Geobacter hydrogenophilus]MBT0893249.1 A/G-specific adenine glycosylase [Geobacter hydrogenophilus]GLI38904.1 endonuclease III [Geobacter hydrogenophilus]